MSSTTDTTELISEIRSICISNKELLEIRALERDFKELQGFDIPYKDLGHDNLLSFLETLKNDFALIRNGYEVHVRVIPKSESVHIVNMVAAQKTKQPRYRKFTFNVRHSSRFRSNYNVLRSYSRIPSKSYRRDKPRRYETPRYQKSSRSSRFSDRTRIESRHSSTKDQDRDLREKRETKKRRSESPAPAPITDKKLCDTHKENKDPKEKSPEKTIEKNKKYYNDLDDPRNFETEAKINDDPIDYIRELSAFMAKKNNKEVETKVAPQVDEEPFMSATDNFMFPSQGHCYAPTPMTWISYPISRAERDPRIQNGRNMPPIVFPPISQPQFEFNYVPYIPMSFEETYGAMPFQPLTTETNIRKDPPDNRHKTKLVPRPITKIEYKKTTPEQVIPEICKELDNGGAQIKQTTSTFEQSVEELLMSKTSGIFPLPISKKISFKIPKLSKTQNAAGIKV